MAVTFQSHPVRFVLTGLVGAGVAAGVVIATWRSLGHAPQDLTGKPAPDFELASLDGRNVRLSALRGKPVLISWWALDCRYCRPEFPHLQRLADKFGPRGLTVLVVNGWDEDPDRLRKWLADSKSNLTMLTPGSAAAAKFGITGYPSATLLDRQGRFVLHPDAMNPADPAEIDPDIEKLLAGP